MRYLVILILCIFALPVYAQNNGPIEVTADNALEWDRTNKTFTATGNAVITQGDNRISAPSIVASYNEGEAIRIRQVVAEPNAKLIQAEETLTADKVTADFNNGVLGNITAVNDVVLITETETLYGDRAVYNAQDRVITVTGNVRIEQDKNILTGNKATFDMNTNISRMTANGTNGGRVKATFYSEASE